MEIKASCKFDYDSIKALTHLWMFKKADPKKRMIFWAIVYAILLTIVILEFIILDTKVPIVLIVALVAAYLLNCYLYFILPKIRYKSLAKTKNMVNEYLFGDDIITVTSKGAEYNSKAEIEYSFFVKVMETSKYFFIYQNNSQLFMVDKSTVVDGTIEDIRNKLSSFVGDKYIICKY